MEFNAKITVKQANAQHRPTANTATDEGRFAQIFKNAVKPVNTSPIVPAPATLSNLVPNRSTFFMQNMPIEQRRSAVEEQDFKAQAAALESVTGDRGPVWSQNKANRG